VWPATPRGSGRVVYQRVASKGAKQRALLEPPERHCPCPRWWLANSLRRKAFGAGWWFLVARVGSMFVAIAPRKNLRVASLEAGPHRLDSAGYLHEPGFILRVAEPRNCEAIDRVCLSRL
jgi:hypothetical protein